VGLHEADDDHDESGSRPGHLQRRSLDRAYDESTDDTRDQAEGRGNSGGDGDPHAEGERHEEHDQGGQQITLAGRPHSFKQFFHLDLFLDSLPPRVPEGSPASSSLRTQSRWAHTYPRAYPMRTTLRNGRSKDPSGPTRARTTTRAYPSANVAAVIRHSQDESGATGLVVVLFISILFALGVDLEFAVREFNPIRLGDEHTPRPGACDSNQNHNQHRE